MQRLAFVSCVLGLAVVGCAGSSSGRSAVPTQQARADHEGSDAPLRARVDQQQKRIAELETRLALLEAEGRRGRTPAAPLKSTETIHIGADAPSGALRASSSLRSLEDELRDAEAEEEPHEPSRARSDRREPTRVLRLHGKPMAKAELPALPMGEHEALLVVPLPEQRASALSNPQPSTDPVELYRAGLRALRERRFDDAAASLKTFVEKHQGHALQEKAMYFGAEARYALREYDLARAEFDALLARYPASDKVADVLLKLGLCMQRLGDSKAAESYFKRVRESYPSSQAATIAAREGST